MTNLRLILVFLITAEVVSAQIQWQFNKDSLITWHYQEGDEFNGNEVNKLYWNDWFGWGRSIAGNKEQQYYSKYKNHFVNDGILTLTAKREDVYERYIDWMGDNDSIKSGDNRFEGLNKRKFTYTAGLLQSKADFLYGYFEIKFRIPKEKGFWPAFWLYGGSPNEEIDWMELKTEKPDQIHVGRHCQNKKDNYKTTLLGKKVWGTWVKFDGSLNEGYNVISGIWTANSLTYYLNGECIAVTKVNMKHPKKLVVNIAVSSNKGSFPPAPREDFKDSVNFEVDYVRVWNRQQVSNRRVIKNATAAEPVTGAEKISTSKLISKSKMHYGSKNDHKNEGFFVSWMPQEFSKYQLTVLGKEIPEDAEYSLTDAEDKIISSKKLSYGITTFDLARYQGMELTLKVTGNGKQSTHKFTAE